jgi:hypothetical protein
MRENHVEVEDDSEIESCPKIKRNRSNYEYDPKDALTSEWYRRYVAVHGSRKSQKHFKNFRNRFRLPHHSFIALVARARLEEWFPGREKCNARGQPGIPLEILILGSLRYLGDVLSSKYFVNTF